MNQKEQVCLLLQKVGLPAILVDGFPHPGMIIRHYRELMIYTDQDGVSRHWTQCDLANALGVSDLTVRLMETKNEGLNSMKRRHMIVSLLNIPPVLLGLSTLDELSSYLQTTQPATARNGITASLFGDALSVYWEAHYIGSLNVSVPTISTWIHRIRQNMSGEQQQTLLCEWYLLLANIYADQRQFSSSFALLEDALQMARGNEDKELEAAILYRIGHVHLDHHTFNLAADALSQAHRLVKYVGTPLRGAISQAAGLALAFTSQTDADRTASERVLTQAERLTDTTEHDPYHVRFNRGRYLLELGDTQIVLNRPESALDTLDEADDCIGLDQQRRKGYISILRAEALTSMQRPRWDIATDQLERAVELSAPIESTYNMEYIGRIMKRIQQSSYANSVPAVQLRMSIQNYHTTHLV